MYRILCARGSTLYGAGVDDSDTLPAVLARLLERDASLEGYAAERRRFEVWNYGTSGYTLYAASLATFLEAHKLVPAAHSGR